MDESLSMANPVNSLVPICSTWIKRNRESHSLHYLEGLKGENKGHHGPYKVRAVAYAHSRYLLSSLLFPCSLLFDSCDTHQKKPGFSSSIPWNGRWACFKIAHFLLYVLNFKSLITRLRHGPLHLPQPLRLARDPHYSSLLLRELKREHCMWAIWVFGHGRPASAVAAC